MDAYWYISIIIPIISIWHLIYFKSKQFLAKKELTLHPNKKTSENNYENRTLTLLLRAMLKRNPGMDDEQRRPSCTLLLQSKHISRRRVHDQKERNNPLCPKARHIHPWWRLRPPSMAEPRHRTGKRTGKRQAMPRLFQATSSPNSNEMQGTRNWHLHHHPRFEPLEISRPDQWSRPLGCRASRWRFIRWAKLAKRRIAAKAQRTAERKRFLQSVILRMRV